MKELSIEQKAQRYNEALKRAMRLYEQGTITESLSYIFPELKESEDERIRRNIIRYLKKTSPAIGENIEKMLAWLEKQGEQKPIDKVEPKFHEGEWIISKYMHLVMQIINNDNGSYKTVETDGTERNDSYDFIERNFKLWTIQDAKDGDVLCCESGWTCIFKTLVNDETFSSYCFMDNTKWFCETGSEAHTLNKAFIMAYNGNIYPATKEQRDLLFQKMKEAGYKWDAEKKEVKKIEQKPTDNEMKEALRTEYEKGRADAIAEIQNPAWSEEDESYLNTTIAYLKDAKEFKKTAENCINWLKSLRPQNRWKPSDEQTKALHDLNLTGNISYAGQGQVLIELYNDLKKLAEE